MERKKIIIENVKHLNRISHQYIVETIEQILKSFIKSEYVEHTMISINTDNSNKYSVSTVKISFVSDYANTDTIKNRIKEFLFPQNED